VGIHHKTNNLALVNFPATAGDLNIYHARLLADQQVTYVLEHPGREVNFSFVSEPLFVIRRVNILRFLFGIKPLAARVETQPVSVPSSEAGTLAGARK
jgi:hypothetical protein